jgi:hypothetical protein
MLAKFEADNIQFVTAFDVGIRAPAPFADSNTQFVHGAFATRLTSKNKGTFFDLDHGVFEGCPLYDG